LLLGLFSTEIADSDFWWHLKTGQFILEHRTLPVPDPFAFTTAMGRASYPGEGRVQHFNLTHEWLAQIGIYAAFKLGGFGGVVLARAALLTAFCTLVGLVSFRRCRGFYRSLAAAGAAAAVAAGFAEDRPFLATFLLLAVTMAIVETRRGLWLLPVVMAVWANAHGGFFLGWVILIAYSLEALVAGRRDWTLWLASGAAILASGLNPNGFQVVAVLFDYRQSFLTSTLLEWARPSLWPPRVFLLLLSGALAVMLWRRSSVRLADWLMLAAFGVAALTAERNTVLAGFVAPIMLASYVPWSRRAPRAAEWAALVLVSAVTIWGTAQGRFFQLHAAEWQFPSGAADFLEAHRISTRLFNTYEYGGYLIWRLWPQTKVFIDGRALNEQVFRDYTRILYNHDESGGRSAEQLLDDYGIEVIVMNGFEYASGSLYKLAPALADPRDGKWKLVYTDAQALVYMRNPPADVAAIDKLRAFDQLEAECGLHIEQEPRFPRCARSLAQTFATLGDLARARRWLGIYLNHPHEPDVEAERTYQQLLAAGH
jgi:hypothetical protein